MRAQNPWLPALAALAFAVLYLVSGFVVPEPPDLNATGVQVQLYFADHSGALAASGYLAMVAGIPFLIVLALLRRRLATVGGWMADTAFGGGLVLAAAATAALLIQLGLALHPDDLDPATARTLLDGALPRWVGLASAAYALYEVIESATVFGSHGAFGPGETINTIGTVAFLPWYVALGTGLSAPEEARPAPAVATPG